MAAVTIVLPTYNRPGHLDFAIRSVLAQNFSSWKLLVVGDACAPETGKMVRSFDDPRVFYVNLHERCGEQSGPISTGSACATGEFIAYMHHDDLWLPDHLEIALAELKSKNADIFVGRAAFTTCVDNNGNFRPGVNALSPQDRTLSMAFYCKPTMFEPTSSWVIRRSLFKNVGPWAPAGNLIRTPAEDWLLRAWRQDAQLVTGDKLTTIYCNADKKIWAKKKNDERPDIYALPPQEQEYWWNKVNRLTAADMRALLSTEVANTNRSPDYFGVRYAGTSLEEIFSALVTPETAELFKQHGWDAMHPAAKLSGRQRGSSLAFMLRQRTGETLPSFPNWNEAMRIGEETLQINSNWFEYECP